MFRKARHNISFLSFPRYQHPVDEFVTCKTKKKMFVHETTSHRPHIVHHFIGCYYHQQQFGMAWHKIIIHPVNTLSINKYHLYRQHCFGCTLYNARHASKMHVEIKSFPFLFSCVNCAEWLCTDRR